MELQIDKGEASAIALAMEIKDSTLIVDDFRARKITEKLGLDITGTIGVILKSKRKGIIPSIKPLLDKISNMDFRLSDEIKLEAIRQAGE